MHKLRRDWGINEASLMVSLDTWLHIDPHLIMFVFLPALIFGDAMAIDTHQLKVSAWQVLMLAGPGVVIGAFATAAFAHLMPYSVGWGMEGCLVLGSILSATDPVAVVGLLKELGAPDFLTILIQGESLVNDGAAVVMYEIAFDLLKKKEFTLSYVATQVIWKSGVGLIIGFIIGGLGAAFIFLCRDRTHHDNGVIQVTVTLVTSFWAFILGEGILGVSGILCVLGAALVVARYSWPMFVSRESVSHVWHSIEFVGNCVIFFMAGAKVAQVSYTVATFGDWIWCIALWAACGVIRLMVILMFKPFMDLLGRPVSLQYCLVMAWGGLRGAIGLALGMAVVSGHEGYLKDEDAMFMLFHIGGMASLTLLVNAVTCGPLVRSFGLSDVSAGRKVLLVFTKRRLMNLCDDLMHDVRKYAQDGLSSDVDTKQVVVPVLESLCNGMKKGLHVDTHKFLKTASTQLLDVDMTKDDADEKITKVDNTVIAPMGQSLTHMDLESQSSAKKHAGEHVKVLREMFLNAIRAKYWDKVNKGLLASGSAGTDTLLESVNVGMDNLDYKLSDFDHIQKWIDRNGGAKRAAGKPPPANRDARTRLAMICAFLEAHEDAQTTVCKNFGNTDTAGSKEESQVIDESDAECATAIHYLMDIHLSVLEDYKTRTVLRLFSHSLLHRVEHLLEQGILNHKEEELFHHMFSHKMVETQSHLRKALELEMNKPQAVGIGGVKAFRPEGYKTGRAIGDAYESPGRLLLGMVEWFDFVRGFGHSHHDHEEHEEHGDEAQSPGRMGTRASGLMGTKSQLDLDNKAAREVVKLSGVQKPDDDCVKDSWAASTDEGNATATVDGQGPADYQGDWGAGQSVDWDLVDDDQNWGQE
mmetsp:Transcript_26068/g.59435  ORF Transcript_26068/g.59435 Transcript_26068/m.59435 type:complete len:867 (-) Transcript_26068:180-2780(-)